jgi:hypothetical protein
MQSGSFLKKSLLFLVVIAVLVGGSLAAILALWTSYYGWQTAMFLVRAPLPTMAEYTRNIAIVPTETTPSPKLSFSPLPNQPESSPLPPPPASWNIVNMKHEYQRLNNCGPASLAMSASTLGVDFSQAEAADVVKGGNLDRNVSPSEMVAFLHSKNLEAINRVNGSTEIIEELVSQNIPVIVHQWLVRRGDGELVGHYRVVRGYDSKKRIFITNDSFNGPNFVIPYAQFDEWWRPFNRGYIPVFTADKTAIVQLALGSDWDQKTNFQNALVQAKQEAETLKDNYAFFNVGTDEIALGNAQAATEAYDKALEDEFPHHFLWYNFGHLESYLQTGRYDSIIRLTDELLKAAGEIEEARLYRAKVFDKQGQRDKAITEAEQAVSGNPRYTDAKNFLDELRK